MAHAATSTREAMNNCALFKQFDACQQYLASRSSTPDPTIAHRGSAFSLPYFPALDLLRIICMASIVSFHIDVRHYRPLLGLGLPTFLLLSIAFAVAHGANRSMSDITIRCSRRLLLPWVAWSAIYFAWALVRTQYRDKGNWTELTTGWGMLVGGTEVHLWFLPFACGASLAGCWLDRMVTGIKTWQLAVNCVVMAGLLIICDSYTRQGLTQEMSYPLGQWMFGFPAIPLGFLLGRCMQLRLMNLAPYRWLTTGFVLVMAAVTGGIILGPLTVIRYILACGVIMLALAWRGKPIKVAVLISDLLLGVYLIHIIVIYGYRNFKGSNNLFLATCTVMAISALITYGLKHTPIRRII